MYRPIQILTVTPNHHVRKIKRNIKIKATKQRQKKYEKPMK